PLVGVLVNDVPAVTSRWVKPFRQCRRVHAGAGADVEAVLVRGVAHHRIWATDVEVRHVPFLGDASQRFGLPLAESANEDPYSLDANQALGGTLRSLRCRTAREEDFERPSGIACHASKSTLRHHGTDTRAFGHDVRWG